MELYCHRGWMLTINFVGDKSWKVITEKYIDFVKQFYKLMADLFNFVDSDCSPSCKEQNFTIQDEDTLAQHVAELLMGQYRHVGKVLDALDSTLAVQFHENQKKSIISILRLEEGMTVEKRDGWIFQMISWIIVYLNHHGENFRQQAPHHHPAQQGIDGFAVVVKDGHLKKILITEDKCTTRPRGKITQQVFPEFDKYENFKDTTAIFDSATTLLEQISDKYADLQNEVNDSANWVYRICVTRDASHKDGENIAKLYKDYEKHVSGDVKRRTGSSTYIDNLREWMQAFSEKIIKKIEAL